MFRFDSESCSTTTTSEMKMYLYVYNGLRYPLVYARNQQSVSERCVETGLNIASKNHFVFVFQSCSLFCLNFILNAFFSAALKTYTHKSIVYSEYINNLRKLETINRSYNKTILQLNKLSNSRGVNKRRNQSWCG